MVVIAPALVINANAADRSALAVIRIVAKFAPVKVANLALVMPASLASETLANAPAINVFALVKLANALTQTSVKFVSVIIAKLALVTVVNRFLQLFALGHFVFTIRFV